MNTVRKFTFDSLMLYTGLQEGGCVDVGEVKLHPGYVLALESDINALQERLEKFENLYLLLNPSAVERMDPESFELNLRLALENHKSDRWMVNQLWKCIRSSHAALGMGAPFVAGQTLAETILKYREVLDEPSKTGS